MLMLDVFLGVSLADLPLVLSVVCWAVFSTPPLAMVPDDFQEGATIFVLQCWCWYPRQKHPPPPTSMWEFVVCSVQLSCQGWKAESCRFSGGLEAGLETAPFGGAGVLVTFSCLPDVTSPFLLGWQEA